MHVAVVYYSDGTIAGYRDGQPYGQPYQSSDPVTFRAGESVVAFGVRHLPASEGRMLAGSIERAQLYDRALTPDEVAASAGVLSEHVATKEVQEWLRSRAPTRGDLRNSGPVPRTESVAAGFRELVAPDSALELEQIDFEIEQLRSQQSRSAEMKVYAVTPARPDSTHVLIRGNPGQPGDLVAPAGIASLKGIPSDFGLAPNADEGQRRRKLAEWLTHPRNPLFARVIVNRLWHYHFGSGLVETPNDFGFNGGRPSHPELLDWLAEELVRQQWSLKAMHRLIVTSSTYRQSSTTAGRILNPIESATVEVSEVSEPRNPAQIDAGNRLLWRKSPQRLEAEAVRDAILCVTGALNPEIGGPGYADFTTFVRNSQFYEMVDPIGQSFHRRSLYRTWVRSGRNGFLDVFDCPDPSTLTPDRAITTTPLQALALMNNSFVLRMSDRFAARLVREAGDDAPPQVDRAFQLAYGRPSAPEETELATAFIREHGLAAFCRVVLNSNEFLYVD
jgi:hypothetical protein